MMPPNAANGCRLDSAAPQMKPTDYDQTNIPAGYDRGRDHGPEVLDLWMSVIASHIGRRSVSTILDLGCGTGRFAGCLANRFGASVIGVDPSEKMLDQARGKARGTASRPRRAWTGGGRTDRCVLLQIAAIGDLTDGRCHCDPRGDDC